MERLEHYTDLPPCTQVLGRVALQLELDSERPAAVVQHEVNQAVGEALGALARLAESDDPWDHERVASINHFFHVGTAHLLRDDFNLDKLAQHDIISWLLDVDRPEALRFMRSQEAALRPEQDRMKREVLAMQPDILKRIAVHIDSGFFEPHVAGLFETAMQHAQLELADAFVAGRLMGVAYCNQEERRIGVSHYRLVSSRPLHENVIHEYAHQAAVEDGGDDFQELYECESEDERQTWLNEAVNQLATVIIRNGQDDTMDPRVRRDVMVYDAQLELASEILEGAPDPLTPREVLAAYFDRTPGRTLRAALRDRIDELSRERFPELERGLVRTIAREYNTARSPQERDAVMQRWTSEVGKRCGHLILDDDPGDDLVIIVGDRIWPPLTLD